MAKNFVDFFSKQSNKPQIFEDLEDSGEPKKAVGRPPVKREYIDPATGEIREIKEMTSVPLILSDRLRNFLGKFKHTIARTLINEEGSMLVDNTYVDLLPGSKDNVTYLPVKRIGGLIAKFNINIDDPETLKNPESPIWTATTREPTPFGRYIGKILGDWFDSSDIESFMTEFKFRSDIDNAFGRFKLVTGKDIQKYYNCENYVRPEGGTLWSSCMRSSEKNKYMELYADNPDKIALLVLFDDKDKVVGRAIVWKGMRKPAGRWFMDRIYLWKPELEDTFKEYAEYQGWIYKFAQTYSDPSWMDRGQKRKSPLSIEIKHKTYQYYPYVDTLKYFTPETGRMGSDAGNYVNKKILLLSDQNGGSSTHRS